MAFLAASVFGIRGVGSAGSPTNIQPTLIFTHIFCLLIFRSATPLFPLMLSSLNVASSPPESSAVASAPNYPSIDFICIV